MKEDREKMICLFWGCVFLKPSQFITLGRNAEQNWPFTGYLHSLKLWDECIEKD